MRRQRGSKARKYRHDLLMDMELDAAIFGNSANRHNPGDGAQAIEAREGLVQPMRWGPRVRPATPSGAPSRWGMQLWPRPRQASPLARELTWDKGIALLHNPYIPVTPRASHREQPPPPPPPPTGPAPPVHGSVQRRACAQVPGHTLSPPPPALTDTMGGGYSTRGHPWPHHSSPLSQGMNSWP